jgi:hypothetical protein
VGSTHLVDDRRPDRNISVAVHMDPQTNTWPSPARVDLATQLSALETQVIHSFHSTYDDDVPYI